MLLLFLWIFSISLSEITSESTQFFSKYILLFAFILVLAYFMFISLALAGKTELKHILEKTLVVGIRKAHYIIAAYSINILFLFYSDFYCCIRLRKVLLWCFFNILIIINFIFSRIFIINMIRRLD